jgi:hypothetical protein
MCCYPCAVLYDSTTVQIAFVVVVVVLQKKKKTSKLLNKNAHVYEHTHTHKYISYFPRLVGGYHASTENLIGGILLFLWFSFNLGFWYQMHNKITRVENAIEYEEQLGFLNFKDQTVIHTSLPLLFLSLVSFFIPSVLSLFV